MDETAVKTLFELGQTAIFLWLYLRERKRVSVVADARIEDYKLWTETLTVLATFDKDVPSPPYPVS